MAKSDLPSVDNQEKSSVSVQQKKQHTQSTADVVVSEGYVSRRVDVKLTRRQAVSLRDRLRSLQDSGARLSNGQYVTKKVNVIQWMLENDKT